jgi:hypothetical protein
MEQLEREELIEGGENGNTSVFTQADADAIKAQGAADVGASNAMYDGMIAGNETLKNETLDMINANKKAQEEVINANTEFTIDQIEQQKAQAEKDYIKEQSGAYVDYQKASGKHGVNAERMAANGLTNTGYSESSHVAMYNQYQNRIAVARSSYNQAITDYNNAITSARLQNNSALAELAAQSLEQRLNAIVTFAQQGNTLLMQKADAEYKIKQTTHSNYMDVLKQIEAAKQYDRSMSLNEEKWGWEKAQAYASAVNASNEAKTTALNALRSAKMKSYNNAHDFLVEYGYADAASGLLSENQWKNDKTAGTQHTFNSYEDYLRLYCAWAVNES